MSKKQNNSPIPDFKPKLAGVMGDPVQHSLSPLLHGYWIEQYGLQAAYFALHVKAAELKDALKALPDLGYAGVNLTIPHKEAALPLMDDISPKAARLGAINTVLVRGNGTLYGTNTDGEGFINHLRQQHQNLTPYLKHCLILGAGGAAKAVARALQEAGAERLSISNRNPARAQELAQVLHAEVIAWERKEQQLSDVSLLVNTTSLGMKGQPPLNLSLAQLPKEALVSDIVYAPLITPLLREAKARGNNVVGGLGMLIHQAVGGFELWFGLRPEVTPHCFALLEERLCASSD